MINVALRPSIIAAILVVIALTILYLLILLTTNLKYELCIVMIIITCLWFKQLLFYPNYIINICPKQNEVNVCFKNKVYKVELKNFYTLGFNITILLLKADKKLFLIPIFRDSLPIRDYKYIRSYLRWH